MRAKHPSVPLHALPSRPYSDRTANGLTRCIIDWIRFNGYQAERVANMGRPMVGKVERGDVVHGYHTEKQLKWVKGSGRNGSADIHATICGRSVKIEVKIGRDRQSHAQAAYAAEVIRAGGVYMIAREFDTWLEEYDTMVEGWRR